MKTTNLHHVIAAMAAVGVPSRPTGRVEVSTSAYLFSHSKRPGGFGSWAFETERGGVDRVRLRALVDALNNQPGLVGRASVEDLGALGFRLWMPCSTYGEARAAAVRLLASFGYGSVEVST